MADIKIFSPQGQPGTIDPAELPQALNAGYILPAGQVQVVSPEGQLGTIDAAEAPQALNSGYQYASPEVLKKLKYDTGTQQVIAGVEGLAQGLLGPIAPMVEKAIGVPEEDILAREKAHTGTSMAGEVLGLVSPVGQGALLTKAAGMATKGMKAVTGAERIMASGARGAIETALFSAGDETSKFILNDPEQSAETAIANIGLSVLLGGTLGSAFGAVPVGWNALSEGPVGRELGNLKNRLIQHMDQPAPEKMLVEELTGLYNTVKDGGAVFDLKSQEIRNLLKEVNPEAINKSAVDMTTKFEDIITKLRGKDDMGGVVTALERDLAELNMTLKQGPAEYFEGLNTLKRKFGKYETAYSPEFSSAANFKPTAREFRKELMAHLEDSSVWGRAAERQQGVNKAYSKSLTPLSEFEKLATTVVNGERVLDPGKLKTYISQVGKANGELKQDKVRNFIETAEALQKEINQTHMNLGLEPIAPSSLTYTMETLKGLPPGAKLADAFLKHGLGKAAGATTGTIVGSLFGQAGLGAVIGAHALEDFFNKVLPTVIKPILEGRISGAGLKAATDVTMAVAKGERKLDKAAKAVFGLASEVSKVAPVDKLDSKVREFQLKPEMLLENKRKVADYMPDVEMGLSAATVRIMQHLASLVPKETPLAALSPDRKPSAVEKARYTSALEIAQDPFSVMGKMKKGTLTQQNIDDLRVMYPKVHGAMASKLMEQAIEAQAKKKIIPYHIRLSMSKFLGMPFDPSLQPGNLLGAQTASSAQSPRQEAPQDRSIKNADKLDDLGTEMRTPAQQREVASRQA